jgi:hypothetical protein
MRENATKLLKHTQELCLNFEKIFDELSNEFNEENLFKKSQVSVKDFFTHKDGQYISDYFFESDGLIKGFRVIVSGNFESYRRFGRICEKLQVDSRVPMILICTVIKPVTKPKKCTEYLNAIIDTCCGYTNENDEKFDWANFDEVKGGIAFDREVIIKNKQWTKTEEKQYDYPLWDNYFSEAKIKIIDIFSITDREQLAKLAKDIKEISI